MPEFDWRSFLREFSEELLADDEIRESQPAKVVSAGWLGFPGATEGELEALEARLGVSLPPSYRSFLAISNGWRTTGWNSIPLWPAGEVGWLRDIDPEVIDIWTSVEHAAVPDERYFVYGEDQDCIQMRSEYLPEMLAISGMDWANQDQLWLNPRVVFEDGEWEAWHFSTEFPGASRYRSFRELMESERRSAAGGTDGP